MFRGLAGFGMRQRRRDLLLGEPGAVIALDQQRNAAAGIEMPRPAKRFVEHAEFLVEIAVLLERRDRFRAARSGIDAVGHDQVSVLRSPPNSSSRYREQMCPPCDFWPPARQVDANGTSARP